MTIAERRTSFPLFERFPSLEPGLPRIALSAGPSPVHPLERLSRTVGAEVWIKNDGLYGTAYGGNKPRKLEFLLPRALETGARTVITTGPMGTHHGLATALYGRPLGLNVALLLTYQRPNRHVLRQLCRMQRAGAGMHYVATGPRLVLSVPWYTVKYALRDGGRRPYLLPPGGSTPLGALGYVNAALELAEQVRAGQLPRPEAIFLPVGSGGTAAGLALGLGLAGMSSTRLIGVAVMRAPTTWAVTIRRLAMEAASLLRRRGAAPGEYELPHVSVTGEFVGGGYGRETRESDHARALLSEDGVQLDPTYTAKAAAGLVAACRRGMVRGPVLYWHTFDALLPGEEAMGAGDFTALPPAFRRFCPGSGLSGKALPADE